MNRNISHKILLVIVLVTLMGAGTMAGEGRGMQGSPTVALVGWQSKSGAIASAPNIGPALVAASRQRLCIYEKLYESADHNPSPIKTHQIVGMLIEE